MAKVTFNKLSLKKKQEITKLKINNETIEVKQYLPINEKLELVQKIVNFLLSDENADKFINDGKLKVYFTIYTLETYTNISFTDKQKEEIFKTYDLLIENFEIFNSIWSSIPDAERYEVLDYANNALNGIIKYKNSAMGILEQLQENYDALDLDVTKIRNKLADPNNLSLIKDILNKLG